MRGLRAFNEQARHRRRIHPVFRKRHRSLISSRRFPQPYRCQPREFFSLTPQLRSAQLQRIPNFTCALDMALLSSKASSSFSSSSSSSASSKLGSRRNSDVDERAPLLSTVPHAYLGNDETDEAASPRKSSLSDDVTQTTSHKKIISILAVLLIGTLSVVHDSYSIFFPQHSPIRLSGVFISNADFSIVLATHALIASEFHDLSNSSWIFVSFGLAATTAQPLVSRLKSMKSSVPC